MSALSGASGFPTGCGTWRMTASSASFTPTPVLPEASTASSAGIASASSISWRTRSGSAEGRSILLIERDDLEVRVHRHQRVGDGLGLDALRGVDDEDRAFARLERARDLVGEVDVPRRVDEVERVLDAVVRGVEHADGLRLDGDAAFPLDVHRVEDLLDHVAVLDRVRELQHAVRERGLAVVDVRDDREVADECRVSHGCVSYQPRRHPPAERSTVRRWRHARTRGFA